MTAVTDEEAWTLAIAMLRQSGEPVWVNNIEGMLESRGFEEAGRWASSQMQFLSLRSKPWLKLPCNLDDAEVERILAAGDNGNDFHGKYAAAVLARRMQRHNISKWHPDPKRALTEAERNAAA
jgi:hypothetical protein